MRGYGGQFDGTLKPKISLQKTAHPTNLDQILASVAQFHEFRASEFRIPHSHRNDRLTLPLTQSTPNVNAANPSNVITTPG